jgi:hypothetical protein
VINRFTFSRGRYDEESTFLIGEFLMNSRLLKKAAPQNRSMAKTEAKIDGYEIESYAPYGDPEELRRFTVWPPSGNAVGDYASMSEAEEAIKQWKERGDAALLSFDGGANFRVKLPWSDRSDRGPLSLEEVKKILSAGGFIQFYPGNNVASVSNRQRDDMGDIPKDMLVFLKKKKLVVTDGHSTHLGDVMWIYCAPEFRRATA